MSKILEQYEELLFCPAETNPQYFEELHEEYVALKRYFNGKNNLDSLLDECDRRCLINSCYWCNNDCDECDIERQCKECYKRCLNQK